MKAPIPIQDIVEKHLELRGRVRRPHEVLNVPQAGRDPDIFGAIWVAKREIGIHQWSVAPAGRRSAQWRADFPDAEVVG